MKNRGDVVGSLLGAALGAGFLIGAFKLHIGTATEPQPGFFPLLGGLSLLVFSTVLFVTAWQGKGERASFGNLRRPAALIGSMVLYLLTFNFLGYVIATAILAVLVLKILDTRSLTGAIVIGTGLSVATFILFDRLLGMGLPKGLLSGLW